jgi:hypothetical protein
MSDTLMTETPDTTNQGDAASQPAAGEGTAPNTQGTEQQATDGQTDGQTDTSAQGEGEGGAKADEGKPQGAPDKYEFAAPEGATLDDAVIEQFSEVAKELNLPQDAAQKILDKMAPAMAARQAEQIEAVRTEWAESAKGDKEFGGEKLQENLGVAKTALEQFGTPELRTLLNDSGLGNHPEVIRFMYRTGKAISEDGFVSGSRKGAPTDPANKMFPNMA